MHFNINAFIYVLQFKWKYCLYLCVLTCLPLMLEHYFIFPVTCIWSNIHLTLLVIQQLATHPKSSKIRGNTKWLSLNHLEPASLIPFSSDEKGECSWACYTLDRFRNAPSKELLLKGTYWVSSPTDSCPGNRKASDGTTMAQTDLIWFMCSLAIFKVGKLPTKNRPLLPNNFNFFVRLEHSNILLPPPSQGPQCL